MKKTPLALSLATAFTLQLPPERAFASSSADAKDDAPQLDQIEVRAVLDKRAKRTSRAGSRLNLSVQDTPASISVITQADLRTRGETTPLEALENAPGIAPGYAFGVLNVSGRGFSGVTNSPALFDGVRYPGFQITPRLALNYSQIEVLRGPAGLAAGQGSIGGAINYVPRRADGRAEGQAYAAFGRFGTSTASLGYGGSVGESALNYRADVSYQGSDQRGSFGYANDTSFAFRHFTGELALPLSDSLSIAVSAESFSDKAEGYFGAPLVNGVLDERLRESNFNVINDFVDMRVNWLRARIEWSPSDTLSGRVMLYGNDELRQWQNTEAYSYQASSNTVRRSDYLRIDHDQELRGAYSELSWNKPVLGFEHQLIVGLQSDSNQHKRLNDSPFRFTSTVALIDPNLGSYASLDPFGLRTRTDIKQHSAFVESALTLSPQWRLISGLRYDRSDVDSFNALSGVNFEKRYSMPSYRVGLVYQFDEQTNFYGSYATSSEPPAQITTLGLANASFDLTDGKQFELGLKQTFARGEWTLALYDLRRTNILSRDPNNANLLIQVGEQAARGVELSTRLELVDSLSLDLSAAALRAQFNQFNDRVGTAVISRRGNVPSDVPERLASATLTWQAADAVALSLGARGVGRRAGNTANTVFLPGYGTIDAGVRYRTALGLFGLRVRNVDDRFFATRSYNGANQFMIGEPRIAEISWQREF